MVRRRKQNIYLNTELSECNEVTTQFYNYHDLIPIADMPNYPDNTYLMNVRIIILGTKDAHIMLSNYGTNYWYNTFYEIVLGSVYNLYCAIKRGKSTLTSRWTSPLSGVVPVPIIITLSKDGWLEVKYEGDERTLMATQIAERRSFEFIGFSCWGDNTAKYYYNCTGDWGKCGTITTPLTGRRRRTLRAC